ncbi:hypothetical protein PFISCL1PPCAC_7541, partial [Pristionchus fissidentatus]
HHKELGTYRFMLLAFVLADIVYGIIHFLTVPVPEVYKNAFVMGGHGWWASSPFNIDIFTKPYVILPMILLAGINSSTWSGITRFFWMGSDEHNKAYVRDFFTTDDYPTYVTHDIADVDNYIVIVYWVRFF